MVRFMEASTYFLGNVAFKEIIINRSIGEYFLSLFVIICARFVRVYARERDDELARDYIETILYSRVDLKQRSL